MCINGSVFINKSDIINGRLQNDNSFERRHIIGTEGWKLKRHKLGL